MNDDHFLDALKYSMGPMGRRAGKSLFYESWRKVVLRHNPNAVIVTISRGQTIIEKPVEGENLGPPALEAPKEAETKKG